MTLRVGEIVDIVDPKGKDSYWDGTQARILGRESDTISNVELVRMGKRAPDGYKMGTKTLFYTCCLRRVTPLSPLEADIQSYIRDQFAELGIA